MASDDTRKAELKEILLKNPGAECFVELARLIARDNRGEAREILFQGLARDSANTEGRLLLANLFYQDGLGEFCVRELVELRKYSDAPSLEKLLQGFGEFAHSFLGSQARVSKLDNEGTEERLLANQEAEEEALEEEEDVLAEFDLEADFDEAFEEIDRD